MPLIFLFWHNFEEGSQSGMLDVLEPVDDEFIRTLNALAMQHLVALVLTMTQSSLDAGEQHTFA